MTLLTRREVLAATGLAAPSLMIARNGFGAAAFPTKPINFIIPYAPGGGFDVYVRLIGPVMEKYLPNKVSIVPVNIAAGGGSRGVAQLYRSKPDGYTIGILNIPGMFILQQQQGTGAYDLSKFSWIGTMGEGERYAISVGGEIAAQKLCRPEGALRQTAGEVLGHRTRGHCLRRDYDRHATCLACVRNSSAATRVRWTTWLQRFVAIPTR